MQKFKGNPLKDEVFKTYILVQILQKKESIREEKEF